jgi:hypothetical protein
LRLIQIGCVQNNKEFQQNKIVGEFDMDRGYSRLQWAARVSLVLLAVFCISTLGMARQDVLDKTKDVIIDKPVEGVKDVFDNDDDSYRNSDSHNNSCQICPSKEKPKAEACPEACPAPCGSEPQGTAESPIPVTIDDLRHHGECYYGKTVTVDGKLDDTYSDTAFTIKGHGHEVLVISEAPMCSSVVPLKGEVTEGKPIRVTAVVEPYDESKLCSLGLEGLEKHLAKSPVLMIKQEETAKVEAPPPIIEPPAPAPAPMPEAQAAPAPEPAPAPPEVAVVIEEKALPRTGSEIPLLGLGGLFALGVAFAIRRFRTE